MVPEFWGKVFQRFLPLIVEASYQMYPPRVAARVV